MRVIRKGLQEIASKIEMVKKEKWSSKKDSPSKKINTNVYKRYLIIIIASKQFSSSFVLKQNFHSH